jgi:uncharacterized protein
MFPSAYERRDTDSIPQVVPAARSDAPTVIKGYGAVFYSPSNPGTEYQIWDDFVERVVPGCFDRAIREDDVRSFFNHDENHILGRNKAGTLKISVDRTGLIFEVTPPANSIGASVIESVRRRDVTGSSFMFLPRSVVWREEDNVVIRELHDVELWEVGPVVFPAYRASTSEARSRCMAEAARHGVRLGDNFGCTRTRLRMLELRRRRMLYPELGK